MAKLAENTISKLNSAPFIPNRQLSQITVFASVIQFFWLDAQAYKYRIFGVLKVHFNIEQ